VSPVFDPDTRPRLAAAAPADDPEQVAAAGAQVLVQIHDHLRAELEQLRDAIAAVCTGVGDAGAARSLINRMTMRQNYWSVGAFCAAYCRVLSVHHTIEDEHMFAGLRRGDASLAPVLDRLSEEHEVIAELLDRLDRSLVALLGPTPDAADATAAEAAIDELAAVLLSHLMYEEGELVGPLARLGILV
jgi:iron-sulfur cluster repair protein YtfE (RIC family)